MKTSILRRVLAFLAVASLVVTTGVSESAKRLLLKRKLNKTAPTKNDSTEFGKRQSLLRASKRLTYGTP